MNYLGREPTSGAVVHISKALAVKEFSCVDDMNAGSRNTMEDGHFIIDDFLKDGGKSILFGVFDGHGGRDCVDYLLKNFSKEFEVQYIKAKKDVKLALEITFLQLDDALKSNVLTSYESGSTACVGIIVMEQGKRNLYTANVGDTRAVLGQTSGSKRVSYDHKADDPSEIERVKKTGGCVMFNRVEGMLAVSRAFGDHLLKSKGVSCMPHIEKHELRLIDKYLVLASDGLWDVCSDQESIDLIKLKDSSLDMAKGLLSHAMSKYTRDNTTVMVLKL